MPVEKILEPKGPKTLRQKDRIVFSDKYYPVLFYVRPAWALANR